MLDFREYLHLVSRPEDNDHVVIFARRHWASYIGQFSFNIFLLILPAIIFITYKLLNMYLLEGAVINFILIAVSIYYLISLTFTFVSWVTFYYDIYILTTRGIIDIVQEGLWGRKISQLSLLQVQDVSSKVFGIMRTIFNFGDVIVLTAAEVPNFNLEAVPNPQFFADKVLELHNELKRRKGNKVGDNTGNPEIENFNKPIDNINKIISTSDASLQESRGQGEVSKDDLNKGGEVKL